MEGKTLKEIEVILKDLEHFLDDCSIRVRAMQIFLEEIKAQKIWGDKVVPLGDKNAKPR